MSDYRRYRVPGGTYFFTLNLLERRSDLLIRHIEALREAVRRTRVERPFHIDGWVVLPDHLHCVLTLPPGDDDFSNRIKASVGCAVRTRTDGLCLTNVPLSAFPDTRRYLFFHHQHLSTAEATDRRRAVMGPSRGNAAGSS